VNFRIQSASLELHTNFKTQPARFIFLLFELIVLSVKKSRKRIRFNAHKSPKLPQSAPIRYRAGACSKASSFCESDF